MWTVFAAPHTITLRFEINFDVKCYFTNISIGMGVSMCALFSGFSDLETELIGKHHCMVHGMDVDEVFADLLHQVPREKKMSRKRSTSITIFK